MEARVLWKMGGRKGVWLGGGMRGGTGVYVCGRPAPHPWFSQAEHRNNFLNSGGKKKKRTKAGDSERQPENWGSAVQGLGFSSFVL